MQTENMYESWLCAVACVVVLTGMALGDAPTVTVSKFDATTGAFALAINAQTELTRVYAAADDQDRGEVNAGWQDVRFLGRLAAGDTVFSGVLPRQWTDVSKKVRFFAVTADAFPGTRVEYLQSRRNGTKGGASNVTEGSYIDTGHTPDFETDLTIDTCYEGSTCSFGVSTYFYVFSGGGAISAYTGFMGSAPTIANVANVGTEDVRHVLRLCKDGAYSDGIRYCGPYVKKDVSNANSMTLFARRENDTSVLKQGTNSIYSAVLRHNGSVIRDYVPYKDAQGVGFLYDRVNRKACYNDCKVQNDDGSEKYPFRVGPEIDPDLWDAVSFGVSALKMTEGLLVPATISDLSVVQDVVSHCVTVSYTLGNADDPVIVTARMLTNGVAVAGANLVGDVSTELTSGAHAFTWYPDVDIPNLPPDGVKVQLKLWHTNLPPAYLVFDISRNLKDSAITRKPRHYEAEVDLPGGIGATKYRTSSLVMRRINAKDVVFRMGSPTLEKVDDSKNCHVTGEETRYVMLTEDFYMGVFEFTQGQFLSCTANANPSAFNMSTNGNQNLLRPLDSSAYDSFHSSWERSKYGHEVHDSSTIFQLRKAVGDICCFDLPTEAQWEFACRAGKQTPYSWGCSKDITKTRNNNNPPGNSAGTWSANAAICSAEMGGSACVGSYQPNDWGLYDMSGNMWEACVDHWFAGPFSQNTPLTPEIDPYRDGAKGNDGLYGSGEARVRVGGGWGSAQRDSGRAASRESWDKSANTSIGYRLICPVPYSAQWKPCKKD